MQVLAGDIGGTKTLLAICEVSEASERTGAPGIEVLASKRFESGKFPGLGAICRAFADDVARPMPRFAGFGVAGPVANGRSHTTNLPWILDEKDLAQTLGIASVRLANDFHTLALGIQSVHRKDLVMLNEGVRDPRGPWAVIGAGTGLGDALSRHALELFCKLYGAEAGNFALKTLATGGVFVAGGIAPRIIEHLKDGRFREAFFDKGRMHRLLEQIPVQVVLNTEAG